MDFIRKNFDFILFPAVIMTLAGVLHFFGLANVPILELVAVLFLVISRPLQKREMPSGFVAAIAANAMLGVYFLQIGLSGQVVLCAFLTVTNAIALYFWLAPGKNAKKKFHPTFLHPTWRTVVMIGVILAAALGAGIAGLVGALDYFAMAAGIIGTLMLGAKKIDAWGLFSITSLTGILLFYITNSYLMLAAVAMFAYNDISAYFQWRKQGLQRRRARR